MPNIAIGISPGGGGGYTAKVPVSSVEESGVPPEEGDKIQCSVEGTVQSVTGGTATISIDSINGEPVGAQSDEGAAEDEGEEGQQGATPGAGGGSTPAAAGGANLAPGMGMAPGLGGGLPRPKKTAIPGLAALGNKLRRGAKAPGAMQF